MDCWFLFSFSNKLQAALKIPQLNEVDWRDQDSKEAIHLLTWVLQSNVVLKFTSDKKVCNYFKLLLKLKKFMQKWWCTCTLCIVIYLF